MFPPVQAHRRLGGGRLPRWFPAGARTDPDGRGRPGTADDAPRTLPSDAPAWPPRPDRAGWLAAAGAILTVRGHPTRRAPGRRCSIPPYPGHHRLTRSQGYGLDINAAVDTSPASRCDQRTSWSRSNTAVEAAANATCGTLDCPADTWDSPGHGGRRRGRPRCSGQGLDAPTMLHRLALTRTPADSAGQWRRRRSRQRPRHDRRRPPVKPAGRRGSRPTRNSVQKIDVPAVTSGGDTRARGMALTSAAPRSSSLAGWPCRRAGTWMAALPTTATPTGEVSQVLVLAVERGILNLQLGAN